LNQQAPQTGHASTQQSPKPTHAASQKQLPPLPPHSDGSHESSGLPPPPQTAL